MAHDPFNLEVRATNGSVNQGIMRLVFYHNQNHYEIKWQRGQADLQIKSIPDLDNGNDQRFDLAMPITDPAQRQNTLLLADRALRELLNSGEYHPDSKVDLEALGRFIQRELGPSAAPQPQQNPQAVPTPGPDPAHRPRAPAPPM